MDKKIHMLNIKNKGPVWEGLDDYNSTYYYGLLGDSLEIKNERAMVRTPSRSFTVDDCMIAGVQ